MVALSSDDKTFFERIERVLVEAKQQSGGFTAEDSLGRYRGRSTPGSNP